MQITVAFNHFGRGLRQRMPRCRWGFFHVLNNDYTHWLMYAVGGSEHPTIISQGNRYTAPSNANAKEVISRPLARSLSISTFVHICSADNEEGIRGEAAVEDVDVALGGRHDEERSLLRAVRTAQAGVDQDPTGPASQTGVGRFGPEAHPLRWRIALPSRVTVLTNSSFIYLHLTLVKYFYFQRCESFRLFLTKAD